MSFLSLMGISKSDLNDPAKAKKIFLSLVQKIKPMLQERGLKSFVVFIKEDGELDLEMFDYDIIKREEEQINYISKLNNKLIAK